MAFKQTSKQALKGRLANGHDPKAAILEYLDDLYKELSEKLRLSVEYHTIRYHQGDLNRIVDLQEIFKI